MKQTITLGHGSGGILSHKLIQEVFMTCFENDVLLKQADSAVIPGVGNNLVAMTTDSYVVQPLFFPGGDIGKLAVCGTINDLAVAGAHPLYLTAAFIIEEGFQIDQLTEIAESMASEARRAGVKIVAGDTKVVSHGQCDKLFITTTGMGALPVERRSVSLGKRVKAGDAILINGPIAGHGMAVLSARENLPVSSPVLTDCAALNHLILSVFDAGIEVKFMRDATRGGVATVLAEIAELTSLGMEADEENIPVEAPVLGLCEILGYDPLYVANEGKVIMIVPDHQKEAALRVLKQSATGRQSALIGKVTASHPGTVVLNTTIGGSRILTMLTGEQLPRIC